VDRYPVTGICIHNAENINNCELLSEEVFLSQQRGFGLLNCAIENFKNLRLLVLLMKLRATST
jgi:hypothetical protein